MDDPVDECALLAEKVGGFEALARLLHAQLKKDGLEIDLPGSEVSELQQAARSLAGRPVKKGRPKSRILHALYAADFAIKQLRHFSNDSTKVAYRVLELLEQYLKDLNSHGACVDAQIEKSGIECFLERMVDSQPKNPRVVNGELVYDGVVWESLISANTGKTLLNSIAEMKKQRPAWAQVNGGNLSSV